MLWASTAALPSGGHSGSSRGKRGNGSVTPYAHSPEQATGKLVCGSPGVMHSRSLYALVAQSDAMKMAETLALRNARALQRFNRALPDIFPAPVLTHATARRWTPPTPRLAVDSYWRAHPLRADRLARALAARSGTPAGWQWRLQADGGKDLPATFGPRRRPTARSDSRGARDIAACVASRCSGWAGMSTSGATARTGTPSGTRPASPLAALERAERPRQAAAKIAGPEMRHEWRASVEDLRGRPPHPAVPRLARASRPGLAPTPQFLGAANLQVINRDAHVEKSAAEAFSRRRNLTVAV